VGREKRGSTWGINLLVVVTVAGTGALKLNAQYPLEEASQTANRSSRSSVSKTHPYKDADGNAVLRAFVAHHFKRSHGQIVIQQEAGASSPESLPPMPERCFAPMRSEFGEAIDDYSKRNAAGWLLQPIWRQSPVRYTLVPASNLVPGWGRGGPSAPGDTRQRVYTILSVVGFDPQHRRAVLSASDHYRLGGGQQYYLFSKNGAVWRLVKTCVSDIVE